MIQALFGTGPGAASTEAVPNITEKNGLARELAARQRMDDERAAAKRKEHASGHKMRDGACLCSLAHAGSCIFH